MLIHVLKAKSPFWNISRWEQAPQIYEDNSSYILLTKTITLFVHLKEMPPTTTSIYCPLEGQLSIPVGLELRSFLRGSVFYGKTGISLANLEQLVTLPDAQFCCCHCFSSSLPLVDIIHNTC